MLGAKAEEGHVRVQCLSEKKAPPLKLKNHHLQKSHAWVRSESDAPNSPPPPENRVDPPLPPPPKNGGAAATAAAAAAADAVAGVAGCKMLSFAATIALAEKEQNPSRLSFHFGSGFAAFKEILRERSKLETLHQRLEVKAESKR